jgi:molybdate transport system substrate-binding protein
MTNTGFRAALLVLLLASVAPAQDGEIRILCSNGFRAAMEKLLPEGERVGGHPVKIEFGPSANFKRAIEGGQQFDLLIVTPQIIGDLTKDGKIAAGTAVDLASSGIGIAVRAGGSKPDVSTAQAIKKTLLAAKSIGYVKVGAGTPAIIDMLNRLGISAEVQRKTALQEGAEPSMRNVADGKVDMAFALISEIVPAPGVQLAGPVPPEFQRKIILTAGISSSTKQRDGVSGIIKSLSSQAAAPAIKAAGMDPIR